MNTYYTNLTIDGIPTLLEVHYELYEAVQTEQALSQTRVTILDFFDRNGDDPGLSQAQVQELAFEIQEFESNRPLGNTEQTYLAIQFQSGVVA